MLCRENQTEMHYNHLLRKPADKAFNIWSWAKDCFPFVGCPVLDGYFT